MSRDYYFLAWDDVSRYYIPDALKELIEPLEFVDCGSYQNGYERNWERYADGSVTVSVIWHRHDGGGGNDRGGITDLFAEVSFG